MTPTNRKYIIVVGYTFSFGVFILFAYTFLKAYFNGGSTCIIINNYGEANIEMFLMLPTLCISFVGLILCFLEYNKLLTEKVIEYENKEKK